MKTKTKTPKGLVLWEGPSRFNGLDVVVIATGLDGKSKNPKTGPMVQTWILLRDIPPHEAVKAGEDEGVCGGCPLRGDVCYVNTWQAPLEIWKAYHRGVYTQVSYEDGSLLLEGQAVRLGAYGDPGAVPAEVWRHAVKRARRWTGYTHSWRIRPDLRDLCMASCDTEQDRIDAKAMGWRYFGLGEEPIAGEIVCPASDEGGKLTTCEQCGLCNGARGAGDNRRSIIIAPHGRGANKLEQALAGFAV